MISALRRYEFGRTGTVVDSMSTRPEIVFSAEWALGNGHDHGACRFAPGDTPAHGESHGTGGGVMKPVMVRIMKHGVTVKGIGGFTPGRGHGGLGGALHRCDRNDCDV